MEGAEEGGFGGVVRDATGEFVAAWASRSTVTISVEVLEAIANIAAYKMKSDAMLVINALNSVKDNWSHLGLIPEDIEALKSSFESMLFRWAPIDANWMLLPLILE
ncbi:hypothetical protein L6164_008552 [Bauhinia variegata]|uniref:Uncharacterized protein n=1 Tax=Bauhinia variegata TaxID=167791 RepID=A0ACB9PII5_BAUVA|nr:hypothetical protein L6164_008552 [Bauhinia variegata]